MTCLQSIVNRFTKLPVYRSWIRHASGRVKRERKRMERDSIVFQYSGKYKKRSVRVYVWGYAGTGALGVRSFVDAESKGPHVRLKQHVPYRFDFWLRNDLQVLDVSCGYGFTVYIAIDGKTHSAYGTGINTDSQLGFQSLHPNSKSSADYVAEPSRIQLPLSHPEMTRVTKVACGRAHTLLVTDQEGVFSIGHNAYGQCARTIVEDELYRGSQIINKVQFHDDIKQVVCGQDHSIILTTSGEIYSCGLGSDGQTGLGHFDLTDSFTKLKGDVDGEKIVDISCKADTVLAASDKGEVFGWGNNEYNQLGVITRENAQINIPTYLPFKNVGKVEEVASAGSMCALRNDAGEVYTWGYGILGRGPNVGDDDVPTILPPTLFGSNELIPDTRVKAIKAGLHQFAAITNSGELYMWGRNSNATLGLGHASDQYFPFKVIVPAEVRDVACGVDHTVAMTRGWI